MFATDPLSLGFLACIVFSGAFLVFASVSGVGHGLHFGAHGLHIGAHVHAPHAGATHNGHIHTHSAHSAHTAHTTHATHGSTARSDGSAGSATGAAQGSPLAAVKDAFVGGFSPYSILILLLIFGLVGYLLHTVTNLGDVLTIVVALLAGDGAAISTGLLLTRIFVKGSGEELSGDSSRLEGRIGEVSIAIRSGGIGEVLFPGAAGGRQSIGARGIDGAAIPTGTEVVILSTDAGIATVQPWESFMAGVRAGTAPELAPLDPS
ncbi:MAG TPA: NfeD family protein [Ktedonobacterales bacterium]|nr:NfeD family protein [Ktedonobacterales bacterium]